MDSLTSVCGTAFPDYPKSLTMKIAVTLVSHRGGNDLNTVSRVALLVSLAIAIVGCGSNRPSASSVSPGSAAKTVKTAGHTLQWGAPPTMTINRKLNYRATVHTTAGNFTINLFASQDPVAVNNFVFLAHQDFFNHQTFFRVIRSFVIQTGDPKNIGSGGPGYTWNGELPVPYPYQPGIVAMAVSGNSPNTNGSQFFICTGPASTQLNSKPIYTEVGRVVQGWPTIRKIDQGRVTTNPLTNEKSYPVHPVSITSVTIQMGKPAS